MVLIFYRGGWCPYCDLHLRGFQRALPELQHFAAQIVAISPQLPDHSLSTQEKDELTFAVLSDRSEADRTGSEQCHHRKAGATNEVIEADNCTYRDNAHKLQRAIAQANGLSVAADIVEESP